MVPIPGTRRRERLEENAAATRVALSADEVADLDATAARIGVPGNRYNDLHMGLVGARRARPRPTGQRGRQTAW